MKKLKKVISRTKPCACERCGCQQAMPAAPFNDIATLDDPNDRATMSIAMGVLALNGATCMGKKLPYAWACRDCLTEWVGTLRSNRLVADMVRRHGLDIFKKK
jgi:hypothetical protein